MSCCATVDDTFSNQCLICIVKYQYYERSVLSTMDNFKYCSKMNKPILLEYYLNIIPLHYFTKRERLFERHYSHPAVFKQLLEDNLTSYWSRDSIRLYVKDMASLKKLLPDSKAITKLFKNSRASPIIAAIGNSALIQILLDNGHDVNERDSQNQTPIMRACCRVCLETIDVLLANGADISLKDDYGTTALQYAIESRSHQVYDRMLSIPTSLNLINMQDTSGNTVLHYAAEFSLELCKTLIALGALIKENECGQVPLDFADVFGELNTVEYFTNMYAEIIIDIE